MTKGDNGLDGVFDCLRCGECCRGRGGIVLRGNDAGRLAAFLDVPTGEFLARHTEPRRGKTVLRSGDTGSCVFSHEERGCAVHPAKPDVCRVWPFFRGNMVDPVSLGMARQGCPGIAGNAGFGEFTRAGARYLLGAELYAADGEAAGPSVLMAKTMLRRFLRDGDRETG